MLRCDNGAVRGEALLRVVAEYAGVAAAAGRPASPVIAAFTTAALFGWDGGRDSQLVGVCDRGWLGMGERV